MEKIQFPFPSSSRCLSNCASRSPESCYYHTDYVTEFILIDYRGKGKRTVAIIINCLANFTTPIFVRCLQQQGPFRTSLD